MTWYVDRFYPSTVDILLVTFCFWPWSCGERCPWCVLTTHSSNYDSSTVSLAGATLQHGDKMTNTGHTVELLTRKSSTLCVSPPNPLALAQLLIFFFLCLWSGSRKRSFFLTWHFCAVHLPCKKLKQLCEIILLDYDCIQVVSVKNFCTVMVFILSLGLLVLSQMNVKRM